MIHAGYDLYVGYLDGKAVAAAELTVGSGVVGLYSICTLVNYRRRGFGMALTLRPLLDARAAGYGVGVLQAGAEGVRIFAICSTRLNQSLYVHLRYNER